MHRSLLSSSSRLPRARLAHPLEVWGPRSSLSNCATHSPGCDTSTGEALHRADELEYAVVLLELLATVLRETDSVPDRLKLLQAERLGDGKKGMKGLRSEC